jgi:hypothetical protein
MPSPLTASHLRKLAQDLDDEERAEREKTTQERIDRLEAAAARGGLSEKQQKTLDDAETLLAELEREDRRAASNGGGDSGGQGGDGGGGSGDGDPPPPKTATRAGRKRGRAYDYDVDEQGAVSKLDVARIWANDDEPDEVEYPLAAGDE